MTQTPPPSPGDLPATAWVSVAEAAEKAGVGTSTVRQWYRTGRLPTQRADYDRGAFLVPLDAVVALADRADADGDALGAEVIDLNASYWSDQTEAAREEAAAAKTELAAALDELQDAQDRLEAADGQLELLRSQLAEASEDARQLHGETEGEQELVVLRTEVDDLRSELGTLRSDLERSSAALARTSAELTESRRQLTGAEHELQKLREISSATGSITDNSWLELQTNAYRSPIRPQGMAAAAGGALSGLLAATTADVAAPSDADTPYPLRNDREQEQGERWRDEDASSEVPTPSTPAPDHALGHHEDDLLPEPGKKGRRGRR